MKNACLCFKTISQGFYKNPGFSDTILWDVGSMYRHNVMLYAMSLDFFAQNYHSNYLTPDSVGVYW